MTVEERLRLWAAKRFNLPLDEITKVEFGHEAGWTSDAGTDWPEENLAIVHMGKKRREFQIESFEFLPELLTEILSIE